MSTGARSRRATTPLGLDDCACHGARFACVSPCSTAALFFISGAVVLALTYAGVSHTHQAYTRHRATIHAVRPVGPEGGLEGGPEVSEAVPGPTGSIAVWTPISATPTCGCSRSSR